MFYALLDDAGRGIRVASLKCNQETRSVRLAHLPSLHLYIVELAAHQFAVAKRSAA